MKKSATLAVLALVICQATAIAAPGKTLGVWKDVRSEITDGMLKTLADAGWQTVILKGKDLSDETKLSAVDVVFLPGGWNAYNFADLNARRALVKYVAGGKGILAGAFRSGYVRTANRPLLPQVGATYNRVNGPYVSAFGDSELAKAIDKPFCPGGWDHLVVKVGPLGKVFAVNGEDPVGVYGEVHGGRYLIFGAFLGMDAKTNAMAGTPRQVLLKSIEWLAGAPRPGEADKAKQQAQADLELLRRETLWNWTLNERGPDSGCGLIPKVHNQLVAALESRQYRLEYMARFVEGQPRAKARAAAESLKKDIKALGVRAQKASRDAAARIERMSVDELLADKPGEAETTVREQLFPAAALAEAVKQADAAIVDLRPGVKAAKAAQLGAERRADLGRVPGLVKDLSSADVAVRREAVRELGRIGDPNSAKALITALADQDEAIRVEAILGLGWMQAKEAVPALIEWVDKGDVRTQSRALQALGQIGDPRAVKTVVARLRDPHPFLAENAILSAGWLKAKEAVPELLKIVAEGNVRRGEERGRMTTALRALGQIGDPAALPALEALAASTNDYPTARNGGTPVTNLYATPQGLGLKRHSELSIAAIKAGGRAEAGVKQPDFLASKAAFYGLTQSFNAFAGRPTGILMPPTFAADGNSLLPHLAEAGFTGVHNAWGSDGCNPDLYARLIEDAGELGLRWIDVLPVNAKPYRAPYYGDNPQSSVEKASADLVLTRFRDMSAFAGFWSEETYPGIKATAADFEAWLKTAYGSDFRQTLGLGKEVALPGGMSQFQEVLAADGNPLKTPVLEFGAARIIEYWRETQDWLRGFRKGCVFTYSISGQHFASYIGLTGPVGDAIAVNGPESYQCFGRDNAFMMEMYKDGAARPVMCEFYNWYTPSTDHAIRGFAQHLMHGECFYNFALEHIFPHAVAGLANWTWDPSRWDAARTVFQKAARLKEYLAVPASGANVAQLCSESTACHFNEISSLGGRWYQQQSALWTALQQSQIPADVIWAETLTPEKLAHYRVLVMSDAKMLTDAQAGRVRDWVNQGGVLIATGSSTLFDRLPAVRKNYGLADVFGVEYAGFAGVADPAKNDTMRFKHGAEPAPVESSMAVPGVRHHVMRDIKPDKSIGIYKTNDKAGARLPGIAPATACEIDMPLGYDRVKPAGAEVLAAFGNGDPALTVNQAGQGLCYFWTPIHPGLCHVVSEWEMEPNRYEFWPNVRELLAAMVKGGLAHQGATLPVDVSGVSKEIEVTVRQQPDKSRTMVHLLDYDPRSRSVRGARLTVPRADSRVVRRLFYPDTGTELAFTSSDLGVTAELREFEVHDMLVVEWQAAERKP